MLSLILGLWHAITYSQFISFEKNYMNYLKIDNFCRRTFHGLPDVAISRTDSKPFCKSSQKGEIH